MSRTTTVLVLSVVVGSLSSISAFTHQPSSFGGIRPSSPSTTTALTSSVNEYIGKVKMDYSGPNLMEGMPDIIGTSALARKGGSINVEDLIEMDNEESYSGYAEVPASTNQIKRSGRWVTAVFWSDLNLYGNILN